MMDVSEKLLTSAKVIEEEKYVFTKIISLINLKKSHELLSL